MPTVTAETTTCLAAIDWIRYQLRDLPLHFHQTTTDGNTALVVVTRPTKRPAVMLHCHIDVSPARAAYFKLTEKDGKYYGRGVFDMKYAAASYLQLLLELSQDLPKYDLGVTFTTDEEVSGGQFGAGPLAAAGWGGGVMINPDAVGRLEPSSSGGWPIQRAAKGLARYKITSFGQAGHGSQPWRFRSAITQLLKYLTDLQATFPAEPCGDPEHGHRTLNIGTIDGGVIANQIAREAHAALDFRMMPGDKPKELDFVIQKFTARYPHIKAECLSSDEPHEINPKWPAVRDLKEIIEDVTGAKPELILCHGGSESGYYMAKGTPVIMFSPEGGGHHSDEEWVSAQGVEDFYTVIRRYVEQAARPA
jgi:acetylornithine deacetylase/succinyl-diaminopimelate desuccinylase-like protein